MIINNVELTNPYVGDDVSYVVDDSPFVGPTYVMISFTYWLLCRW